ncbi:MAG: cell division protein FtsZ [Bacteroidales bacterium]|nr:cell division protein FtsZ [Bacteroidales bacterium]
MDTNDNMQNMDDLVFDSPKNQTSYIKVIGVGGGGNNAVNHMYRQGISGVDFIVCNTDQKALNTSPVPNKIMLGNGMGAGNNPDVARAAAEEKKDELRAIFEDNTKMLFIAAGMGGGTGTGAAPVIAKLAKEVELKDGYTKEILVVAIVTMPFFFEGVKRMKQAMAGLEELRNSKVDSVLVINNDKLLKKGNLPLPQAYALADDVLLTAARGISEIITVNSYINIDFEDVNAVMAGSGTALMGVGTGAGEDRATKAIEMATTSELLNDNDISGAKDILLYISYSENNVITVDELSEITDYMTRLTGSRDTNVIWGQGADDTLTDEIKITLIATGFEAKKNDAPEIHKLDENNGQSLKSEAKPAVPEVSVEVNEANAQRRIFTLGEKSAAENKPAGEHIPGAISFSFGDHSQDKVDDGMQLIHKDQPAVQVTSNADTMFLRTNRVEEQESEVSAAVALSIEEPAAEEANTMRCEVVEPETKRIEEPTLSPEMKTTAEERIKRMHDLLHNNPMGPKIAEEMTPAELMSDVSAMPPLSESDMPTTYLSAGGRICKQDGYLDNKAD